MTFGPVVKSLTRDGVIPVVCFPNPKDGKHTIKVAFGPKLDSKTHNPVALGTCYRASEIYNMLRMKNAVDHHDAWHSLF